MSTAMAIPARAPALESEPRLLCLSVDQYEKLVTFGVLNEDDRVELIDGLMVEHLPQDAPYATTLDQAQEALRRIVPAGWQVREQKPIRLATSMPEPDLVVLRAPFRTYGAGHPGPADLCMVVEVSYATLAFDRGEKGGLYAQAKIAVYWVINIVDCQVEVYTRPRGGKNPAYRSGAIYRFGQSVPVVIEDAVVGELPVDDLIWRPETGPSESP